MLVLVWWWTLELQEERIDQAIAAEAGELRGRLVGRSVAEMAAVVTRRSTGPQGSTTMYLLASERREYIAGNLRDWPREGEGAAGATEFALGAGDAGDDEATRARGIAATLPSGHRLLVARDVTQLRELGSLVTRSLLIALGMTVVLGVAGGALLGRRLSARLDAINRNSRAILEGDLHRRMPVSPRGDEFDALAANLNRMLDRIESLMTGMREVSDSIAHDLRSPISRLRSRIEVSLMGPPGPSAYREVLAESLRDIDDVLGMFNALLAIALAESGEARERFVDVDLAALAADTVDVYEPAAEEAGLELVPEAASPVPARGDAQLLRQALANLLDNAIKYVPRGGRIVVRAVAGKGAAGLAVVDDGPGIPESFRDKAFERFTRVDPSRTRPGSGLGLSLVRAVARLHGGEVTIADARPGLAVEIRIPAP